MDQAALQSLLDTLIATWENEVVEFKEVGDSYPTSEIGKYYAALANEANLRGVEKAWLVFGVNNKKRSATNSDFRTQPDRLQATKKQIADGTEPSVTFRNIYEIKTPAGGRVVLFEIPAAPRGMPIAWNGHYYARAGESLVALGMDKQDEIRQQTLATDWTAQIVPDATLNDLDDAAVAKAQTSFAQKYANRFTIKDVESWPLPTFLDRARLSRDGKITRTAILLLGKHESSHFLNPHMAQMTWKLDGPEQAYEHFGLPFLLTTTELYQKIRNIQIRLLPAGQLIPHEISKYDRSIVLEALHNCIAHQDYQRMARIIVIEKPDRLVFENVGNFFEGQPDDYIMGERIPCYYRNPFLVQAMAELGMIDTMGYGIHRMARGQAKRYFPLPDYDLSQANVVRMTIYGGVVDPAYTQLLMKNIELPFNDILALDRVQKKLPIPEDAIVHLRREGLIDGRKPHFHVSATVADATESRADYMRVRALDNEHYKKLITQYLKKFGKATRVEIDDFLLDKLSDALSDTQKSTKISSLLTSLRRAGVIKNYGTDTAPEWRLDGSAG